MVHKKFTYKNGKRFGPYYYETKRVNGKIITRYLGLNPPEQNKNFLYPSLFLLGLAVLLLSGFYFSGLTGKVTLDLKTEYNIGETIIGNLNLNILEGELIPRDSKILVLFNGEEKEFILSDLVDYDSIEGKFYAENLNLSGEGEGFGSIGEKVIYPEIEFQLKIVEKEKDKEKEGKDETSQDEEDIDSSETNNQDDVDNSQDESQESDETSQDEEDNSSEANLDESKENVDAENEEDNSSETNNQDDVDNSQDESQESDETVDDSNQDESDNSESSEDAGESESESSPITGGVINELGFIYGEVSKEESFEYEIGERDVKIVPGTVKIDGEKVDEALLKLKIKNGILEVSTDYEIIEEGFGDEFLGEDYITLTIDIEKFNLIALNDSLINIRLVYENQTIVEVEEDISINVDESVKNESIDSEIIIESNVTIESNVSVEIFQFEAVLGQPVKWKKKIDLENGPAIVNVELPKKAENITIKKLDEKEDENLEILNEVSIGITGEVTADLNSEKESNLIDFIKRIFSLTGYAVEDSQEIVVELNETEDAVEIEYFTEPPRIAFEEELEDGKLIKVAGSDEVHYKDVLIFSELNESFGLKDKNQIKIYWEENNQFLEALNIEDFNNNSIYDYVEFIAPQLSNQTFKIIVITNALYLDVNRSIIANIYPEVKDLDEVWSPTINSGEYVRISFEQNLTSDRDITVYPRTVSGNPRIEIYEIDGAEIIAQFNSLNDNEYNKVFLDGLQGSQDRFDLKILDGSVEFDHIIDPVSDTLHWWTENGEVTLGASTTTSVDLSKTVDTSKAFILLSRRAGSAQDEPSDSGAYAEWVNGGRFNLVKSSSEAGAVYVWQVIEGQNIEVQNGTQAYSLNQNSFDITINAVNTANTAVFMTFGSCGSTTPSNNNEIFWTGRMTSSTNLRISRSDGGACAGSVAYFVVEFNDGTSIQQGSVASIGSSYNVDITSINSSNTWYYFSSEFDSTAVGLDDTGVRLTPYSPTRFTLSRYANGGTAAVYWYAISTPGAWVQNGTYFAMTNNDVTISSVVVNRSFSLESFDNSGGGTVYANSMGTSQITSSTNLHLQRATTGNTENMDWQVITLPEYYSSGEDTTAPLVTISTPRNSTYNFTNFPLTFNVELNEDGDTVLFSIDGLGNISMETSDNRVYTYTNSSMLSGSYTFRVFANDTAGNKNYTESVIFSVNDSQVINSCGSIDLSGVYTLGSGFSGTENCLEIASDNVLLDGNWQTISGDGGLEDVGILVSGLNNVTVKNLNISNFGIGVFFNETNNSLAENISVSSSTKIGLYLKDSSFNTLSNSTINPSSNTKAILIRLNSINNTLVNTNITYSDPSNPDVGDIEIADLSGVEVLSLVDTLLKNYSINGSGVKLDYKLTGKGRVQFLDAITGVGGDFESDVLISNNLIYVNPSVEGLNRPATITLYNMPGTFSNPIIYKDGVQCTDCYNFTSLNDETVIFNVSGFSTYTIDDVSASGILVNVTAQNNFTHLSIHNSSLYKDLQIYYSFDANTSASKVYDYTSLGNDGTLSGAVRYADTGGVFGGYMEFDGTNGNRISLSGTSVDGFQSTSSFSVLAWIKTPGIGSDSMIIADYNPGTNRGWALYIDPNGNLNFVVRYGASFSRCITSSVVNNQWHFVGGSYNGIDKRSSCQVNSAVSAGGVYTGTNFAVNAVAPAIGELHSTSSSVARFDGLIDEVMIFNRTTTYNEAMAIFQNSSPRFFSTGSQTFVDLNVSENGDENMLNISLTEKLNFDPVNFTVRVGNTTSGAYAYGDEFQITNGRANNIPIGNPNNISVSLIFHSDINKYYSPVLVGSISLTGWSSVAADTTPPGVTINFPEATTYYKVDSPLNFSVSLTESGNAEFSLNGLTNYTMYASDGSRAGLELNLTNSSMVTGFYNFLVHANDTVGNKNYTENIDFTYNETGIDINFSSPTPFDDYLTSEYIFVNFTTGENQGLHYSFTDLDNSLVLWLPMEYVNDSLDPTDFSSYSNNGTAVGSVLNSSGKFAKAFEFDGINDYISIEDDDTSLDLIENFTWSAWVYLRNNDNRYIVSKKAGIDGAGLRVVSGNLYFSDFGGQDVFGSQTISTNTWYHVASVYNGTTVSLYVNGVLDINNSLSLSVESSANLIIGAESVLDANPFQGMIDDFLMFNRALSASEIAFLYDSGTNKYENNFSVSYGSHSFKGYVMNDVGIKNETETLTLTARPEQVIIEHTTDCSGLYGNATLFDYGYDCEVSGFKCVGLNSDLNITSTGRLNLNNSCIVEFNTTDGKYGLYLEGVLNLSGANITSLNSTDKFNLTINKVNTDFVDSFGNVSFANIFSLDSMTNISDSRVDFNLIDVNDKVILLNSTDFKSYTLDGGILDRRFRLNVTVRDDSNIEIPNVNVTMWNVTGDLIHSGLTNSKGAIFRNLTEYIDEGDGKSFWNSYVINYSKVGYKIANSSVLNITSDYNLELTLELYDTIVVSSIETLAEIYTRVGDSLVFNNLSDGTRPCRYVSRASINITSGGELILDFCNLEFNNTDTDGEFNLYVSAGGHLMANYSNITNFNNLRKYVFRAVTDSELTLKNSYFSSLGETEAEGSRGFYLNTTNVTFINNTLFNAYEADIEISSSNIILYQTRFLGGASIYNVYCTNCKNVSIVDSNISKSTLSNIVVLDNEDINFINSNFSSYNVQTGATLYKRWYADNYVNDSDNVVLLEAIVDFYNNTLALTDSGLTNSSGMARLNISEYIVSGTVGGGVKNYQGNYTVNATKRGYSNEEKSVNVTDNFKLSFNTLQNPFPSIVLNSPIDGFTGFNFGDLNYTLNVTAYDAYNDLMKVKIYGINGSYFADLYNHGLIYKGSSIENATEINYNWTSPIARPDDNTILLMHFDNESRLGENSSYIRDFSYLTNNATVYGDVRPVQGRLGGAFELDGLEYADYIKIPHSNIYNVDEMTIITWIKPYDSRINEGYILSKDDTNFGADNGFWLRFNYKQNYTEFDTGQNSPVSSNVNSIVRNQWQQIAVTINSTTIIFYANGQNIGDHIGSYSFVDNANDLFIGKTVGLGGAAGAPLGYNGSLDDLIIYNRSLSHDEVNESYYLQRGSYIWKVNVTDTINNNIESDQRQFRIGPINSGPSNPTPEINSTDGSNKTLQDLNCYDVLVDSDGDRMNVTVEWHKNSQYQFSLQYNDYENSTFFNAVLDSGNTTKGDIWTCGMKLFDGIDYSELVNSTESVTILNSPPPIPTLLSPLDSSTTTNRLPTFSWGGVTEDDDGDVVLFELNISCYNLAGGVCAGSGDDSRFYSGLSSTSYTLLDELKYFIDNGDYYNWTVRATDGIDPSDWSQEFRLNVTSLVEISLPNNSVEFGVISPQGNRNTLTNDPIPFLIRNDGNVFVNVTIRATDLWAKQANPSVYYQYKVDENPLEPNSFNSLLSRILFRNMPLDSSPELAIAELNYSDSTDSVEIDINITVPFDEPADVRSSTVTFTASLAE